MIRVLIADDHALVRRGLRNLLDNLPDINVVGEAADASAITGLVASLRPDVLLLDISMPGTSFLDLLASLRTTHPRVRTLIVSAHAEEMYARRAIRAGAAGYITKTGADEELVHAVRMVAGNNRYISAGLAQSLATDLADDSASTSHHALTNREHEVMMLLAAGHTVTGISELLSLSVKTVSTHRTRILRKMNLTSNSDLVRYALVHELLDSETFQ